MRDEIRPKLERFQREAAKVLWEAFQAGRLTADVDFDALLAQDSPEAQAYKMAQAVLQLPAISCSCAPNWSTTSAGWKPSRPNSATPAAM